MGKHYYIYGSKEHPERVIAELKKLGGQNLYACNGTDENSIYFLEETPKNVIVSAHKDELIGQVITTHPDWERLYPEPDYRYNIGDKVRMDGLTTIVNGHVNKNGEPYYNLEGFKEPITETDIEPYTESKPQFQPFQKVLVRDDNQLEWQANIYSHFDDNSEGSPHFCVGHCWRYCIPYEGNKHLLGTIDNPD